MRKTVAAPTFSDALVHWSRPPSIGLMTRCCPLMSKITNLPRRHTRSNVPPTSCRAYSSGGVRRRKLSVGEVQTWAIFLPSRRGPRYSRRTSSSGSSGTGGQGYRVNGAQKWDLTRLDVQSSVVATHHAGRKSVEGSDHERGITAARSRPAGVGRRHRHRGRRL